MLHVIVAIVCVGTLALVVMLLLGIAEYGDSGQRRKCRHRWTRIPPHIVDPMARLGHGLPDAFVGSTVPDWCVKCRIEKDTGARWEPGDQFVPTPDPERRLAETTAAWLADPREAWETVGAYERDVERILAGDFTTAILERNRMPLRPGRARAR